MYPYIEIFQHQIPLQWLGISIATLVFLYGVYRYSQKSNLKFAQFFNYLYIPLFLFLPYFLWRYFYNILEYHLFIPDVSLLSPYHYKFSFIWVSAGLLLAIAIFLRNLKYTQEKKKWFDVFFYSISLALIVVWPFLLLGDVFFGTPTNSSIWVHALTTNTQIPYPTQNFWPVGILVSFLGLALYLLGKLIHLFFKKPGTTIFLFPLIFIGFWWIFHLQYYPKHFLFGIDIKLLYCILVAIFGTIFFYWLINRKW
jgi:hypothetical protein